MATNCIPVEETVGVVAGGGRTRQRPRARRINRSGNSSSHHVHSHQISPEDAQAAVISDPGRRHCHRQSSESYTNRTHAERSIDQSDEVPDLETDSELQLLIMSTPRQEMGFNDSEESYNVTPSLSMLRIDLPEKEILLQPSLGLFTSLAEPNLLSPPLSPLPQDRELTTALIYHECDSPVGEEHTMWSQQEAAGSILGTRVRQERVMSQERYDSEEFRCMESAGKLKHWGPHTFADIL